MRKKILAAIMIAMGLLAMTACGAVEDDIIDPVITPEVVDMSTATPAPTATEAPTAEPTATPEVLENGLMAGGEDHPIKDRKIVDGKMQSYLTGEWKDADVVQRRNMAVMIPNNPPAMPQYGLSLASVIYEAPVEGRITRLMALFEDYDELDKIGPVRSSRDYYVYEAMAYDSIYVNWGLAVPFVGPIINTDRIDNVSYPLQGIEQGKAGEAFGRISRPGYATEFTGYMFVDGYNQAVDRLGYDKTYEDHGRFEQAFTFADEGYVAEYKNHEDATVVRPGGSTSNSGGYGSNKAWFEYNEDDGLYYRFQYGEEQIDEYSGEQLAVSNVVFKICHGELKDPNSQYDYLGFGVHGTGDAYVFTNGKVIKGTWQRNSDYEPNLFLDENGNEIIFNQGKTWICCVWKEYQEYMSWE